jgi:GTP cyclohydrolase I
MKYNKFLEDLELIDSDHKNYSIETPLREDAFLLSDEEKINIIQKNVGEILHTLRGVPLRLSSVMSIPRG